MTQVLEKLVNRYFKIYFFLCLIAFTAAILLMNMPQAFPADQGEAQKNLPARFNVAETAPYNSISFNVDKFCRWKVSPESASSYEEKFVQLDGTRLLYQMKF
jgi:hypothetical protein